MPTKLILSLFTALLFNITWGSCKLEASDNLDMIQHKAQKPIARFCEKCNNPMSALITGDKWEEEGLTNVNLRACGGFLVCQHMLPTNLQVKFIDFPDFAAHVASQGTQDWKTHIWFGHAPSLDEEKTYRSNPYFLHRYDYQKDFPENTQISYIEYDLAKLNILSGRQ